MSARKSQSRKKRVPQWNATVTLPRGAAIPDSPPLIVNYLGATLATDSLRDVDPRGIRPGRTFVATTKKRNRPMRPYLFNAGNHIIVESQTEAVEAHLLDREPSVQHVIPQGVWVKTQVRPPDRHDAPPKWGWACVDFLVQDTDGRFSGIEVKRSNLALRPRPVTKLLAAEDTCRQVALGYEVRAGLNRLEGMVFRQLHHGRRSARYLDHPDHDLIRRRMSEAATAGPVTLAELRDLGEPIVSVMLLWEQLWHQVLCLDWNTPIASDTPIRLHSPECEDARGTSAWDFRCGPKRVNLLDHMREWAYAR